MRAVGFAALALVIAGGVAAGHLADGGPVVRSIALPTGVTLEYAEQGRPDGVPVVLLHGYTDSRHSWNLVLPRLPDRYRVFAISQRGHGESSKPFDEYRGADFAGDIGAFLDAKKIDRAIIVGHSMGSMVAQQFTIDNPSRVQALVLTGAFYVRRDHPVLVDFWNQAISTLPDQVDSQFVLDFQTSTVTKPLAPEFLATILGETARVPGYVWRNAFREFLRTDLTSGVGTITAPTLIIWGDRDAYSVRQDQDSLVTKIRGAKLLTYEGIGHAANWEVPERFAEDLVSFLDGQKGRRAGGQTDCKLPCCRSCD
ncbi:MAG TPA: alpha/beta hydrolase [Gemmatimonadales bacterium]|nr:alpha/beta hydrolase [Gemmatimonadales bacterium]